MSQLNDGLGGPRPLRIKRHGAGAIQREAKHRPEAICTRCGLQSAPKEGGLCGGCRLGFRSAAERRAAREKSRAEEEAGA